MSEEEKKRKNKKISQMNLSEVESALKKAMESMNGENSKYIQHLKFKKEKLEKK